MIDIARYGSNEAGPEGSMKKATFSIVGQMLICTDSVVQHGFGFAACFLSLRRLRLGG
jgi:predicted 3-demethylubiquinone-9 3-methyltransferase (glyoxalase superfamily)